MSIFSCPTCDPWHNWTPPPDTRTPEEREAAYAATRKGFERMGESVAVEIDKVILECLGYEIP